MQSNSEEKRHALLSASSAHRWMVCSPSAKLEKNFKDAPSLFAEEGTFMHKLAELQLNYYLGKYSRDEFKHSFECMKGERFYSEDIYQAIQIYVDLVIEYMTEAKQKTQDPIILIEQRLDFSEWVEGGFGTGDTVIISEGVLDIVDLKGGRGIAVSAIENPQMKLYALGALALFDILYDIQTVRMTICQPRLENISTYELPVDKLRAWAEEELRVKAQLAWKGEGDFLAGKHCRFCKARYTCRARADEHLALARNDFKLPVLLSEEEIAEVLTLADRLAAWASDVYAYATDLAIREGKEWQGYKLVEGRCNRRYTDDKLVAEAVTAAGYMDIYKKTLIGISEMEKLIGKKKFKELLADLIEKPAGKPTLVPVSDKRQAINSTAEADFKEEINYG